MDYLMAPIMREHRAWRKRMNYWITGDEHFYHANIIKYCNRPFSNLIEMHNGLIARHNAFVKSSDIVIHNGDFSMGSKQQAMSILKQLNGVHILIRGSHDKWLGKQLWSNGNVHYVGYIYEKELCGCEIVICHYAMRVWHKSHFNSYHLFAHSHGRLEGMGKSMDVGIDTNNYYPYSLEEIIAIMKDKPDNPNFIGRGFRG
jgi:calcineurin-like phosphoesterase family protein